MIKKLKQKSGETLVETLVSLLIAVLSIGMLTSALLAATNINRELRKADEEFRSQLQSAESREGEGKVKKLQIEFYSEGGTSLEEQISVEVTVYGSEDSAFLSYEYPVREGMQ